MRAIRSPCVRVEPKAYEPPCRYTTTSSPEEPGGVNHSAGTPPASTCSRFTRFSADEGMDSPSISARCVAASRWMMRSLMAFMKATVASYLKLHPGRSGPCFRRRAPVARLVPISVERMARRPMCVPPESPHCAPGGHGGGTEGAQCRVTPGAGASMRGPSRSRLCGVSRSTCGPIGMIRDGFTASWLQ